MILKGVVRSPRGFLSSEYLKGVFSSLEVVTKISVSVKTEGLKSKFSDSFMYKNKSFVFLGLNIVNLTDVKVSPFVYSPVRLEFDVNS